MQAQDIQVQSVFYTRVLTALLTLGCAILYLLAGCGSTEHNTNQWDGWATEVIDVHFGEDAGFGQANFPDVVLGPPKGAGMGSGSLDVLSLGVGGTITLGFGQGRCILDRQGDDVTVLENVFLIAGNPTDRFIETARVAVSQDGDTFIEFPTRVDETRTCTPDHTEHCGDPERYQGFAGIEPAVPGPTPDDVGGDRFDLEQVGLRWARYVRITDTAGDPLDAGDAFGTGYGKAGFDLDAVGVINRGQGDDCPGL